MILGLSPSYKLCFLPKLAVFKNNVITISNYLSLRAFSGAVSLKSITVEVFLRCEWININPPPPIPVICGSDIAKHNDEAIAASIAFPP